MTSQLATFAANYVGHPFNASLWENKGLYTCLCYMSTFLVFVTLDIIPPFNAYVGLVSLPAAMKAQVCHRF